MDPASPLVPFAIVRRDLRPNDVAIEILYCGVCHSDLHQCRNHWGNTHYPVVAGHEIIGRVTATGAGVTRHAAGDVVAICGMIDSCQQCDMCARGEEQNCRATATATYNGADRITGERTYGGYSRQIVVRQEFALKVRSTLDPAQAAPLLCAGLTMWTPLRTWGAGPATRVGIIGMGGLGHIGVKLAAALGCETTVFSGSCDKAADAAALGARHFVCTGDADALRGAAASCDLLLDTIPVAHDITPWMGVLDVDGTLVMLGAIEMIPSFHASALLRGRRRLSGSGIGGTRAAQELLDFCADHAILPECEIVAPHELNTAFERLDRGDVRYRFVADMRATNEL